MSVCEEFFDFNKPCPPSVENCMQLRQSYQNQLDQIMKDSGCSGCKAKSLKAEFTTIVWKSHVQHMGLNLP
jgi:hypothetical protein